MGRYKKPFTIFKRGAYWYYRIYTQDGYRTAGKTTGQTTKTAAMNYCNELLKLNLLGVSDITFREYAEHFYDDDQPFLADRAHPMAESTKKLHRQYLNNHLMPLFGPRKLHDISYTECKAFRQSLLQKGLKANTINGIFQTFNNILKFAYLDNKIQKNPLQGFGSLERDKGKDAFTREEIIDIVKHTPLTLRPFIMTLALTGMRMSEAMGVTAEDIKQEDGIYYIDLKRQLTDIGYYTPLKTRNTRVIPIIPELVELCTAKKQNHNYAKNHMKPIIRNIPTWEERKLSIHSIRHFFITDTKSRKLSSLIVETVAGHSLQGIEAVYTNFHLKDLLEILDWQKQLYEELSKL